MRDGELARRRRAAELVGDDRLAACRRAEREFAQRSRRCGSAFEEQQVAVDIGIVERAAQISPTEQIDLVADRDEARKADRRCALPRDISAPIMVPECEAKKVRPTGMSGSAKAALAVSITPSRRLTTPRLDGPITRMPVSAATVAAGAARARRPPRRSRRSRPPGWWRSSRPARPHSATVSIDGFGRHQDIGVVGRLGQRRNRLPGALAQHGLAARIDADRRCRDSPPGAGNCRGRPVVLPASSDCPTIATERGDSSARRSAARSVGHRH